MADSRAKAISTLVEVHIATAISGVTIVNEPVAMDTLRAEDFPVAVVLFEEDEPERLAFKQERRRINGVIHLGKIIGDATQEAAREVIAGWMDAIRDAIFGDETLTGAVDDVMVAAAPVYSQKDDVCVYGDIDIDTEAVF